MGCQNSNENWEENMIKLERNVLINSEVFDKIESSFTQIEMEG